MTEEGKAAFGVLLQTWKEMATAVDQLTQEKTITANDIEQAVS
jgi:hypothetical protein